MNPQKFELKWAGKKLVIETGYLAGQTNGSCTVRYKDTVVLATAVISKQTREGIDFFPLLVDYEEKLYAAGKIKGSRWIKREGRPTDEAVLTSRLVDRSIRPFFDERIRNDIQVVLTVLSVDQENDPDIPSLIAASVALAISNIPWQGPLASIRVGRIKGEWILNPSYEAREKSDLDLVLAGVKDKIVMVEAGANEVKEDVILEAIGFGQKHLEKVLDFIEEIREKVGLGKLEIEVIQEKTEEERKIEEKIKKKVDKFAKDKVEEIFKTPDRQKQRDKIEELKEELDLRLKEDSEVTKEERGEGVRILDQYIEKEARRLVLKDNRRVDGRKLDELREITCEIGILPRTHGSGLFNRGETQVLSVVTLGAPGEEQFLDGMEVSGRKRFMHHYNFPGFSTGEVSPIRAPGRREIGHGALAERALIPILPSKEDFPYTIRVVSEVLSSNGSTSMASACGSSLALMDAGIPVKRAVAGIAMGLVQDEESGKYKILADIQGVEDHGGDMDLKVAGTRQGITAIQMDIKGGGLDPKIFKEALEGGRQTREIILEKMESVIREPRKELSPYAPRVISLQINPEKIRDLIGPGGKVINKIIEETGVNIDIEDDGLVMVTSDNKENLVKAVDWIKMLTHEVAIGEVYEGTVTQIVRTNGREIGALVEILPGQIGMVHISQFTNKRISNVSDVVKVGDKIKVKVMDIDKERGRIELSHRALIYSEASPSQSYRRD